MKHYFVTGTDTEVGKSFVSAAILHGLASKGYKSLGFKPIAAGCEKTHEGLRNEDGLLLQESSNIDLPYDLINPIRFEPPVAPHLAAKAAEQVIDTDTLTHHVSELARFSPDVLLIEGAGGWRLPLGQGRYLSDWCIARGFPVILVVGMKLGCLNHAVLTAEAIENDGLHLVGWVANHCEQEMPLRDQNIETLKSLIKAPLIGEVRYSKDYRNAAQNLDLSLLV